MRPRHLFLFMLFFLFGGIVLRAQDDELDSLVKVMKNEKNDTVRLGMLVDLSENCDEEDILTYSEPAIRLADSLLADDRYAGARLRILRRKADAVFNTGYIYQFRGQVLQAIEYFQQSLDLQTETGDKEGVANSLNSLGYIYENQGETDKALEYYQRSLVIRKEIGFLDGISSSLNNIGVLYLKQGDLARALDFHHQSLRIREENKDTTGIANSMYNLGVTFSRMNSLDSGMFYLKKSLWLRTRRGDKNGMSNCLAAIGTNFFTLNQMDSALDAANRSYQLSKETGFPDNIERAADLLNRIYRVKGDYKAALQFYEEYIQMRDSVSNEENRNAATRLNYKYEFDKKESDLASEQKRKQEINDYRNFLIVMISILVLVSAAIISLVIYRRYKLKKRTSEELAVKNEIIERKNKEITDSIHYSQRIQQAILPPETLVKNHLPHSFILFKPKDIVSGDFYWVEKFGNWVVVAAVDCTGHGVPGAFMSFVAYSLLNEAVGQHGITRPAVILAQMRKGLFKMLRQTEEEAFIKDGMDISICAFDLTNMKMEFAGAYNPVWIIRDKELIEIKGDKIPVGAFVGGEAKQFTNHEMDLKKGDSIYLFTDGYADQFGGGHGKKFKYSQLKDVLIAIHERDPEEQKTILGKTHNDWRRELEQIDDILVIGVGV